MSSLETIRRELIAPASLMHKDRTVKAFIACCLADMLRLYAPDAPYSPNELRDIFQFFVRQLRNLASAKVEASNVVQYHYLLQSLSEIKSIALVAELPGHDEVMTEFFTELFDVIRYASMSHGQADLCSPQTPRNIEQLIIDILFQLIDEVEGVPSTVVNAILAQFSARNVVR